jgi:hypothetical protein
MSYIDPDQLHGALDGLITFVGKNATTLTGKGLDPTIVTASLTVIRDDLAGKKDIRDGVKTDLTTAQQAFANSAAANYASFSSSVDAVAGALGKSTPLGKQALNYRKHLNATTSHNTPAPVPPVTDEKPPATDTK